MTQSKYDEALLTIYVNHMCVRHGDIDLHDNQLSETLTFNVRDATEAKAMGEVARAVSRLFCKGVKVAAELKEKTTN